MFCSSSLPASEVAVALDVLMQTEVGTNETGCPISTWALSVLLGFLLLVSRPVAFEADVCGGNVDGATSFSSKEDDELLDDDAPGLFLSDDDGALEGFGLALDSFMARSIQLASFLSPIVLLFPSPCSSSCFLLPCDRDTEADGELDHDASNTAADASVSFFSRD